MTILFVFAINITGEEPLQLKSLVPKYLALILTAIGMMSLIFMILPAFNIPIPAELNGTFRQTIWVGSKYGPAPANIIDFCGSPWHYWSAVRRCTIPAKGARGMNLSIYYVVAFAVIGPDCCWFLWLTGLTQSDQGLCCAPDHGQRRHACLDPGWRLQR